MKKEGRPLLYGEPVIKKSFSLEKSIGEWLNKKNNLSRFVNDILKKEKEKEELEKEENELPIL